jgi:N,N-dimethylformamidase
VIEIRRGRAGHRTWSAAPGEEFLSSTGEPGGLWRDRGRPPQRLFGVGYTAVGPSTGSHWPLYAAPYLRRPDSFDASIADLFEGVDEHELIGDFGLIFGGAAGLEIDRVDVNLGTPPHTKVLASSVGHPAPYFTVDDPVLFASQEDTSDRIRSDIVYVEYPNGGAVFSVGSMSWLGCLSTDDYNNNVSTITENVLKRFTAPKTPAT